jgi:hypothetical protein
MIDSPDASGRRALLTRSAMALVTEPEIVDELAVPIQVGPLEVFEQTPPLANHHQQSATAVVVFLMFAEVVRELVDACRQKCNLNGGAATIRLVQLVLADDFVFVESHWAQPPRESTLVGKPGALRHRDFEIV